MASYLASYWQDYDRRSYYRLTEIDMRNQNEKRIFKAIEDNDVESLRRLLQNQNPVGYRLGCQNISLLSVAVLIGNGDVVKYLIDQGCDSAEIDKNGNTALHVVVKEHGDEKSKKEMVDILLAVSSNAIEAIFAKRNKKRMTPFLLACHKGFDAIISRFCSTLENNSVPISKFIGSEGNNCFHYRLDSFALLSPTIIKTVQTMIEKIPCSPQLIEAKNENRMTPFQVFLEQNNHCKIAGDVAKIFFQHGVSYDGVLERAILDSNKPLIEVLLRRGCCHTTSDNETALFYLLKYAWVYHSKSELIRMIELFLAFGYDLQRDLFLYTIDERPIEYASPVNDELLDTTDIDPDILQALRELRRSNQTHSLQRQCRNTLRRHLKPKADEVFRNLTCIPNKIKSFLLIENEQPLLKIPTIEEEDEDGDDDEDEDEEQEFLEIQE